MYNFRTNRQGITTLEILIVLVILASIFTLSAFAYVKWQRQVGLINNTDELKTTIIHAQQLATATAGNNTWGIHIETDRHVLFKGSFYNESDPDNQIRFLQGAQILDPTGSLSDGAGGYGPDIVFAKFTGETVNIGTITIAALSDLSITRTIDIEASGQVN